jgi:hypothetical protein
MFDRPIFQRSALAVSANLAILSMLAAPAVSHAQNSANQGNHGQSCKSADEEAKLNKKERALLGASHAEEHARVRAAQCEVEQGVRGVPAKGNSKPAKETLEEDEAVKKDVLAKVAKAEEADAQATAQAAAKGGGSPKKQPPPPPLPPEATLGRWSTPFVVPVTGVTAVLLHTGNVMFWSYDPVHWLDPNASNDGLSYIWNPTTRTGYNIKPPENIWCGGQTLLSDGRVYIAGGNLRYPDYSQPAGMTEWEGALSNYTFNPISETWARQPDMKQGRWYPTVTKMEDGRAVVVSGMDETGSGNMTGAVEVFTPDPNMDGTAGTIKPVSIHSFSGLYPLQFLLPGGKLLEAGPGGYASKLADPATWNWSILPPMGSDHYEYGNGVSYTNASVLPMRQLVMVAGGHDYRTVFSNNEWLDGNNPNAGWKPYPKWAQPRHNANTVMLPDGSLLTVGGNSGLGTFDNPVFSAELYSSQADDTTGSWKTVAPHAVQGAYHSSAILLPDATVLMSQDDMDRSAAAAAQHKVQVYSPPYLFKGAQPKIVSAPSSLTFGQSFTISTDRTGMTSAVLVAPGAATHGNDMHQRVIKLPATANGNGLTATVPASSSVVPPGYYMLFVLDSKGIPSVAKFVRVA